jgi:hypothetical protein
VRASLRPQQVVRREAGDVHTIEVFRLEAEDWLFVRAGLDEAEAALAPFDAGSLDLGDLWSE